MFKPVGELLGQSSGPELYTNEKGERFVLVPVAEYERLTGKRVEVDSASSMRDTGKIKREPWDMPLDEEVGVDDVPL